MTSPLPRPRLLFLRESWEGVPERLRVAHVGQVDASLAAHFDVVTADAAASHGALLDRHRPDVVLVGGGYEQFDGGELAVRDPIASSGIPHVGLMRLDGHSWAKHRTLDRFARFGVEAVFALDTGFGQATPGWADHVFYWPWAIDPAVYRPLGLERSVPIGALGEGFWDGTRYPWRRGVAEALRRALPVLSTPRPSPNAPLRIEGEAYVQLLNRCQVALGCGGVRRIVVRKLLEIPACGALLVTEDSEAVRAFGFVHGVNALFVTPDTAVDEVGRVLADPDRLAALATAGQALVTARHLAPHRDQLAQWLELRRTLAPGERIAQPALLGPLVRVPAVTGRADVMPREHATVHLGADSEFNRTLAAGWEALLHGDPAAAHAAGRVLLADVPWSPDAQLLVGWGALFAGALDAAAASAVQSLWWARKHGAPGDPVPWALLLLAMRAAGRRDVTAARIGQVIHATHPLLLRTVQALLPGLPSVPTTAMPWPLTPVSAMGRTGDAAGRLDALWTRVTTWLPGALARADATAPATVSVASSARGAGRPTAAIVAADAASLAVAHQLPGAPEVVATASGAHAAPGLPRWSLMDARLAQVDHVVIGPSGGLETAILLQLVGVPASRLVLATADGRRAMAVPAAA